MFRDTSATRMRRDIPVTAAIAARVRCRTSINVPGAARTDVVGIFPNGGRDRPPGRRGAGRAARRVGRVPPVHGVEALAEARVDVIGGERQDIGEEVKGELVATA
jgi:hypothetical protein